MAFLSPEAVPLQLTCGTRGFLADRIGRVPPAHFTAEVREIENRAITAGISGWTLMRRAGSTAWKFLQSRWGEQQALTVLCGGGNNGGDGCVVAALAAQAGWRVRLVECPGRSALSEAADRARRWALEAGAEPLPGEQWQPAEDSAELLVDALLGTGLKGEVRPAESALLARLDSATAPVFSLDVPSGLCADTGALLGCAPRAEATLTFIATKPGLWTSRGREHCGEIHLADLGLPAEYFEGATDAGCPLLLGAELRGALPQPPADAHKGMLGHLLVAGGDDGMGGAAILAAEAALRSGAGLVSAAVGQGTLSALLSRCPEIMARAVANGQDLEPMLAEADTLVLGPGLGSGARAQQFVQRCLHRAAEARCALVVDAGALRLLAAHERWRRALPPGAVLTPHPGEAADLLGLSTAEVQADRFAAARRLSQELAATVILKGAGTLVAERGEILGLCPSGNPGMATAGCGDVLAGIVGALLARGMTPAQAARLAVAVHAEAGDRVATLSGTSGLTAGQLMRQVPPLLDGC